MPANFTVTLSEEALKKLDKLAEASHMSKADIIRRSIELFATIQETKETNDIFLFDKKTKRPTVKLVPF